jgi:hypothetical protein
VTRFGLCRHDYALTPCPKDKDCINCGEHYVVKGDEKALKEAKFQLEMHEKALEAARKAVEDGEPGAKKWLERHQNTFERWNESVRLLESDDIPQGHIITLPPPEHSQSKTGLAQVVRDARVRNLEK